MRIGGETEMDGGGEFLGGGEGEVCLGEDMVVIMLLLEVVGTVLGGW